MADNAFGGNMQQIRGGDVSGYNEARRRKAREEAVKTGALSRTGLQITTRPPSEAEIAGEIEGRLETKSTLRGTEVAGLAKATEARWEPTTDDPMLPSTVDLGTDKANTTMRKASIGALRTNDTYESSLQSRPCAMPQMDGGGAKGFGVGRRVGLPASDRVVHTKGAVGHEYAKLPTDAYRRLAEADRKQGIGSNLQVRY
mmetsp:Transcript_6173/g.15847  ORF Transcript_6173/g.15847 Transcript_6173/m.15847 type:complete len:200 (-) Transcript_6173:28-627(-)